MTETLNIIGNLYGDILAVSAPGRVDLKIILNLLQEPTVKVRYRLFLLNPDETINREIPREDIILSSGSYSENYENGQRRNLNIALNNESGQYTPSGSGFWINDRFRFDVGIMSVKYNDEDMVDHMYWFPKGIYVLGNPTTNRDVSDKKIDLTLLDKFAYLEGPVGTLEATYEITAGTEIESAINGILNLDNGMGHPIDYKPIIYSSAFKGKIMPYTLKKDAGSTLADLLMDIATILNAEIFYNTMGNLTFIPIDEVSVDVDKPTLWDYDSAEADLHNYSITYDFENAINSVHVVGDEILNAISYAVAENNNPESPICIPKIGRRILYINDANIYNNRLAKDRARYELRKKGILNTSSNVSVSFNPLLGVNNLITITDPFFHFDRERFLIQSISFSLGTDNRMALTCSNLMNFVPDPDGDLEFI